MSFFCNFSIDITVKFSVHFIYVQGKKSYLGEQLARQELFLFTVTLLQHFDIRPPEGQEHINDTWKFSATPISPTVFKVRFVPIELDICCHLLVI